MKKNWNNSEGRIITKKIVKCSSRINDLSNNFKVSFSVDSAISWYNIIATGKTGSCNTFLVVLAPIWILIC